MEAWASAEALGCTADSSDAGGAATRPRKRDRRTSGKLAELGAGSGNESDGECEADLGEATEKKTRFVWTTEMHHRFERAVHKLGVSHAKPQAIRQLIGCEGEAEAPTRQNIKSHLQKYRQHRQNAAMNSASLCLMAEAAGATAPHTIFDQYQLNLLQQLELQATLHDQLLGQRREQAVLAMQLSRSMHTSMRPEQLTRLAQHVMLQRQLLQHLFALLQAHTEDVMREGSQARAPAASFPYQRPSRSARILHLTAPSRARSTDGCQLCRPRLEPSGVIRLGTCGDVPDTCRLAADG